MFKIDERFVRWLFQSLLKGVIERLNELHCSRSKKLVLKKDLYETDLKQVICTLQKVVKKVKFVVFIERAKLSYQSKVNLELIVWEGGVGYLLSIILL